MSTVNHPRDAHASEAPGSSRIMPFLCRRFHTASELTMHTEIGLFLGYPAAFLTTIAFVPQAWQSWRTRDLSGISLPMYTLFTTGVALWLCYGVAIGSPPIVVANAITLLLASLVLWLKVLDVRARRNA